MRKMKYFIANKNKDTQDLFTFGENDEFAFVRMNDSNLSRFYTHTQNGYFVISASRSTNTEEENVKLTKELEKDIRSAGLGFISTLGGFVENGDTPVEELSFLVPYKKEFGDYKRFVEFALELGKKYKQEDVLIQVPDLNNGKAMYLNSDGDIDMIFESWGIKQENEPYYTRLKKGSHSDMPFTFRDACDNPLEKYSKFKRVYLTHGGRMAHRKDLDLNLD